VVRSRRGKLSSALVLVLCASAVAGAGSAAGVTKDACPAIDASGPSPLPTLDSPAGSVLVGASSAKVGLPADPTGQTTYVVEYGTSVDYGVCTQTTLTGLTPQTAYHFRVVATSGTGTAFGDDQTFTTLPAGQIAQGATINGVAVGGMGVAEAVRALQHQPAPPARLVIGKRRLSVARAQLGAKIDGVSIAPALQALPGQTLTVPHSVDAHRLESFLAAANRRFGQTARAASVGLVAMHAVVVPSRSAIEIDKKPAEAAIAAYLRHGRAGVLRLPLRRLPAPVPSLLRQKAVVVRLGTQTLTAYLDGKPVLSTPVTTGRPALPTPIGSFYIHMRSSPYVFTSPWPQGSPYWYPPTPATWAMYFYDNDFLHDDPGEPASAYGAGSENGPYASHGCIHVPHDAMAFLYGWLPVGATVIVAQN
jgi:hypothetical protein